MHVNRLFLSHFWCGKTQQCILRSESRRRFCSLVSVSLDSLPSGSVDTIFALTELPISILGIQRDFVLALILALPGLLFSDPCMRLAWILSLIRRNRLAVFRFALNDSDTVRQLVNRIMSGRAYMIVNRRMAAFNRVRAFGQLSGSDLGLYQNRETRH